jgi:excisionase family DNA binding protein
MPTVATMYADQVIARQITADEIPVWIRNDVQEVLLERFLVARTVTPPPARWLTITEAAQRARVTRRTIYTWLSSGKLTTRRTAGGFTRIDPASLFTTERP